MNKLLISAALGAALLTGSAATAQDGPRGSRDPLARADADNDGAVTRAELLADVEKRFARADANKDGRITADEREALGKGMRGRMARRAHRRMGSEGGVGRMMMRADADGDGNISLAEHRAQAEQRFAFVDVNKDGSIDAAERAAVRDRMMAMRGRDGHRGPPPPPAGAPDDE